MAVSQRISITVMVSVAARDLYWFIYLDLVARQQLLEAVKDERRLFIRLWLLVPLGGLQY